MATKSEHRHGLRVRRWTGGALAAIGLSAIAGCGSSRPVLTDAQLEARSAEEETATHEIFTAAIGRLVARASREAAESKDGSPPVCDILAMSGGGDYGAFGAGVLVGWGNTPDPARRRPDFDAVTGVSTGSLLAPFAYVGTDAACKVVENFYRNPKKDWVIDRGLLFFMPWNASFMELTGLNRDIQKAIDKQMIEQMAEQSRKGKVLAVSATNLDLARQQYWDLGVQAETAAAQGNPELVQRYLLASAAIPAVFPPVAIDGFLYADGGVTANVFLRLDPHSPDAFIQRYLKEHPGGKLPKIRYWVIINNQLKQPPKTIQPKWPAVVGPSLSIAIRSATIDEVRWLATEADYANCALHTDIEVWVTAIPDQWRPPVPGDFQKKTMDSLSDLGEKMGANPDTCWTLWSRPLAPARHEAN